MSTIGNTRKSSGKKSQLEVQGTAITLISRQKEDFISLTDMVKPFDGGSALIEQWLKNKDTVMFLGVWEQINNPDFKTHEFEGIKNEAGRNSFYLSAKKWGELTAARGLFAKAGRNGGTYAHKDIAFEFGSWLSPEFKLYLIKDFQRLKEHEISREDLAWDFNRTLVKLNHRLHTAAVKSYLVTPELSSDQVSDTYSSEADLLNMALFGQTAEAWREADPKRKGNLREHATIEQLLVLANLEAVNAELIRLGLSPSERLQRLNDIARQQLQMLTTDTSRKALKPRPSKN